MAERTEKQLLERCKIGSKAKHCRFGLPSPVWTRDLPFRRERQGEPKNHFALTQGHFGLISSFTNLKRDFKIYDLFGILLFASRFLLYSRNPRAKTI